MTTNIVSVVVGSYNDVPYANQNSGKACCDLVNSKPSETSHGYRSYLKKDLNTMVIEVDCDDTMVNGAWMDPTCDGDGHFDFVFTTYPTTNILTQTVLEELYIETGTKECVSK